jgi:acyl-CoA synthetase (AMP-forming)/AMP-acid ligase II
MRSFCAVLADTAAIIPDKPLFVFPETRWNTEDVLTYANLASRSAGVARVVKDLAKPGDRALLLCASGAAFWEAFMGCLASGIIAVPLKTPNLNRDSQQLLSFCRDCAPSIIFTDDKTAELLKKNEEQLDSLKQLPVVTPGCWRSEPTELRFLTPERHGTAYLQYTSGSTSTPKGVEISHENLFANIAIIRDRMGIREFEDSGVTWLPHYHDMGLVGSYLTTLFTKTTSWCFPPEEFAIRPARIVRTISDQRVTLFGGPDFTYRHCVEKISDEETVGLDLSSLRVAYVGAERIRAETLNQFSDKFLPFGFRRTAFFPCYGLGEATLMVTGGPPGADPMVRQLSSSLLMGNRIAPPASADDVIRLVGCGRTFAGSTVVVFDNKFGHVVGDDKIGEILVSGSSVTRGYFNRPDLNGEVFRELIVDGKPESFLRTGDLGFLADGELFVTGRLKEIIIVRGRNFSPEDIELRIADCHASLAPDGAVAFSVEIHGEESLVIAAELRRSSMKSVEIDNVSTAIRSRIVEAFGVNPAEILLMRTASLPRTSSGKPRRLTVRDNYLNQAIEGVILRNSQTVS